MVRVAVLGGAAGVPGHSGGPLVTVQHLGPVLPRLVLVVPVLVPGDVVGVRTDFVPLDDGTRADQFVVVPEPGLEQRCQGPAVQDDVVKGDDELPSAVADRDHRGAQEHVRAEVEAPGAVGGLELLDRPAGVLPVPVVERLHPWRPLLEDQLVRGVGPPGGEDGPQDAVVAGGGRERRTQHVDVQIAAAGETELLDVRFGSGVDGVGEEHALLHRGQAGHRFDVRCVNHEPSSLPMHRARDGCES